MKFIATLNSINPQVWAFLILLTGCIAVLTFHKAGIDIGIGIALLLSVCFVLAEKRERNK